MRRGRLDHDGDRDDTGAPPLTSTDLGAQRPRRVHDTRPLKHWQARQIDQERQRAALLNVFEQMAARLGGILALDQAAIAGDVLATVSRVVPANGVLVLSWKQAAAAIVCANHSAADAVVSMGGLQSQAPSVGTGVFRIPAGSVRVLNLRGNEVAIYGAPGSMLDLVALARPREPFAGPVAQGPLEAALIPAGTAASSTVLFAGNRHSLVVVQNVTAASAGNTLTTAVNGVSPSGAVYPILAGAALAAPGVSVLRIGPGLTPAANAAANDIVPRQVQIVATVAGAPVAYGIDVIAGA